MAAATAPEVPKPTANASPPAPFDFAKAPGFQGETFKERFMRKTNENPFVPIGCLATVGALVYGLSAFKQGNTRQSQLMMRGRIFAQGFTVVAIIFGVFSTAMKSKE